MLFLANVDADGNWVPGIGDPTPFGWIITFAYLAALLLSIRAWRCEDQQWLRGGRGLKPRFWLAISAAMLLLGINKQLDLQTLISIVGRRMAKSEGWYGQRRDVQVAFIALVALLAIGTVGAVLWWTRGSWRRYGAAAAGVGYLCFFIWLRAASFHHVDTFLYHTQALGLFVNRLLELGGIVLIGWCAWKAWGDAKSASPRAPEGRRS